MTAETPWRGSAEGIVLTVRVTPRSARTRLDGFAALGEGRTALAVRLAAPPIDGEANDALIAFLAALLSVRKADIAIRSGRSGRTKSLAINGDPQALIACLAAAGSD